MQAAARGLQQQRKLPFLEHGTDNGTENTNPVPKKLSLRVKPAVPTSEAESITVNNDEAVSEPTGEGMTDIQQKKMFAQFGELGIVIGHLLASPARSRA